MTPKSWHRFPFNDETVELFDAGPPVPAVRKQKPQFVSGWTRCPSCISHDRVALILSGEHLSYREHTYLTYSGTKMTCGASSVTLCVLPPLPSSMGPALRCPHDGPL